MLRPTPPAPWRHPRAIGTAPPKPAQDTAERRQVTVMFSDLVGSTALSARMDPEDLREVISAYQKCIAETVQRFGGFVAKYMGDGVLVYFGYPQAHEDDAERAVRAGLESVAAVTALRASAPLQTRIGVATGLVVVGDLIGSGAAQEQAVVGETPNVAARLQGIAEPNTVVICRAHYNQSLALYKPDDHRPLATRFTIDARVSVLSQRSKALWLLGYPEAARADVDHALENAREMRQAAELMLALTWAGTTSILCRNHTEANAEAQELIALAEEKGALQWKAHGMLTQGCASALTGKAADAVEVLTSAITAYRATGATFRMPLYSSYLARAYAELGQLDDAWYCIDEAITMVETTKERWCEAEVHRIAGEITLKSPERDAKAEGYFNRALAVARQQQAKSWELRAAMSMTGLWRDQGKRDEARELLAPVYGWFTEGFDTLDLKEAKKLLDELAG